VKVLLTGATGVVGGKCLSRVNQAHDVLSVLRKSSGLSAELVGDNIDARTDWSAALTGCDVVVHCAARVHVMNDESSDPIRAFCEVNVEGTANLARQAAAAGVKRFIFLSSIKVNGEFSGGSSSKATPFRFSDTPRPEDPYGVSKFEAEEALKAICAEMGMEYVIIRPPLVYGPGVKANFLSLLKWVVRGVPLPLGGIKHNKRSLVYVDN